jgi:metal-dependent HD superfamily phosphatase/phosphodiesterase
VITNLPLKDNPKLDALMAKLEEDGFVPACWKLADLNSIRAGVNDHGPTHVKIVAHIASKLYLLLAEAGVPMSVVKDHGLEPYDAQVVVVMAALLHDIGMDVHRDKHEEHSLFMAYEYLMELYDVVYTVEQRMIMVGETLHAMIGHNSKKRCLTIEAGIVKVADALDMTKWRSRSIIKTGKVSIHALSVSAIDRVHIDQGKSKPIGVEIVMNSSAGIFQVDDLLKHKVLKSGIHPYIEVSAHIESEAEDTVLGVYNF